MPKASQTKKQPTKSPIKKEGKVCSVAVHCCVCLDYSILAGGAAAHELAQHSQPHTEQGGRQHHGRGRGLSCLVQQLVYPLVKVMVAGGRAEAESSGQKATGS